MNARLLSIDQVLPGAVLGDNVHDDAGRVLLRMGTVLTESSLEALRRRGVETLPVEALAHLSAEHLAHERVRIETRLQEAFRRAGESQANRQLWQAVLEYKLGVE